MTITLREFVGREIICCASSLISDLAVVLPQVSHTVLRETSLDSDDIMDLCQRPNYEAAADSHIDDMDRDGLIEALSDAGVEDVRYPGVISAAAVEAYNKGLADGDLDPVEDSFEEWCRGQLDQWPGIDDDQLRAGLKDELDSLADGYKDFVEKRNLDYDYDEVYEHWICTDWLAARLAEKGEITGEVSGLTIWGRCTTGQAISMDHVIQRIYKDLTDNDVTSSDY